MCVCAFCFFWGRMGDGVVCFCKVLGQIHKEQILISVISLTSCCSLHLSSNLNILATSIKCLCISFSDPPPLQHHKKMGAPNDCMHLMVSLLSTPSLEKRQDPGQRCLRCVVLTLFVLGVVKPQSSAHHVQ